MVRKNHRELQFKKVIALDLAEFKVKIEFGAVFVDEGQDFSDDMIQVDKKFVAKGGTFWLSLDKSQILYKSS